MPHPLVILRMGPTLSHLAVRFGEFEDWIRPHLGWGDQDIKTVCPYLGDRLPSPPTLSGVVITGAGAMVTETHPWIETSIQWLQRLEETSRPVMGICFGHQLLAKAFGGQVDFNPLGPEVGTVRVAPTPEAANDALLAATEEFHQHASHRQSVLRLPPAATCLARTKRDPHHAFRIGDRIWGVQFHPEFSPETMTNYLDHHSPHLVRDGQDVNRLKERVQDCPEGRSLLQRFGQLVRQESAHG